jgi:hypothetical protein
MADALNVEPAVAIAAATKPIAILRIMMLTSIRSEHPSLSESNPAVLIELQRAALSPGVPASKSQLVGRGGCGLRVTALPSTPLPVPGVGRARWLVELIRCRAGESAIFEDENTRNEGATIFTLLIGTNANCHNSRRRCS